MGDICINIHIEYTFADTSVCFAMLATSPATIFMEAAGGRLLHMVTGEVAIIAKTYRSISKYASNMYIDAYISNIPVESLSSQSSHTHLQACP